MSKSITWCCLTLVLVLYACHQADRYSTDTATIARGQKLFELQCGACHNFHGAGISPSLAGVTSQVSSDWLGEFIRNPIA